MTPDDPFAGDPTPDDRNGAASVVDLDAANARLLERRRAIRGETPVSSSSTSSPPSALVPIGGRQTPGPTTRRPDRTLRRALRAVDVSERMDDAAKIELLRTARALAVIGLPRRPTDLRDFSRVLRLGQDLWAKVTYTAAEGKQLPYGQDRLVLAGIQHLALQQDSPDVEFKRVGDVIRLFGLDNSGVTLRRLRERFTRLVGLSIHLVYDDAENKLADARHGEQLFVIRNYELPTRQELANQQTRPVLRGPGAPSNGPYGVTLSRDLWAYLRERKNQVAIPLELLRLFVDRPAGWDFLCFLWARCMSARAVSFVPHEALLSLFRDSNELDRQIIENLRGFLTEIRAATDNHINAEIVEQRPLYAPTGGRPKKQWALRIGPSFALEALTRRS